MDCDRTWASAVRSRRLTATDLTGDNIEIKAKIELKYNEGLTVNCSFINKCFPHQKEHGFLKGSKAASVCPSR